MQYIHSNVQDLHITQPLGITIGNFDGLHLGHQKVLKESRQKAKSKKLKFGLVTFEPVPTMFFNKNIKNHRINSLNQKIYFLMEQGRVHIQ